MKAIFVDTGGWMALANESDGAHRDAIAFRDRWMKRGGVFVSTDYVVDETLTLIRLRRSVEAAHRWWHEVEGSPRVSWELIDPARAAKAREWFFRWRDKRFSFTDCTSFVVMRERRLTTALTTDRHFAQAGFEMVPGDEPSPASLAEMPEVDLARQRVLGRGHHVHRKTGKPERRSAKR